MKAFLLAISFLFLGYSYSQTKADVDIRLIENHGDEIYNILKYRKDYYNFLLWELDNGYKIVPKSSLRNVNLLSINNVVSKNGIPFDAKILDKKKEFNLYNFNFQRQKNSPTYYDLNNGYVLMFTSLTQLWDDFRLINKKQ